MVHAYEKLISDAMFTQSLGEMVLAVGRLEGVLLDFLAEQGVAIGKKTPLGGLIKQLESRGNLSDTVSYHLNFLLSQRNYFVHKIAQLMHGYEVESKEIETFRNRVKNLREQIEFFASMFNESPTRTHIEQGAPADRQSGG